jgi:hypothetical protein
LKCTILCFPWNKFYERYVPKQKFYENV